MMGSITDRWQGYGDEDPFDLAIECLLVGLLAFMPLAFGAVEAWSEEVVIGVTAAIVLCFCVRAAIRGRRQMIWTWAYVPVAVLVLVAAGQLLPLPAPLVRLISPHTLRQKMDLLQDLHGTEPLPDGVTLSFYPHMTAHDLRLVLALAAVFVVVLNTFRRPDQIRRLLRAIVVIGAGIAFLAMGQDLVGNGRIYWCVRSPHGTSLSGPFVNHSHYAQFMNLSMGAALGLLCMEVHQVFGHCRLTPLAVADYLSSSGGRVLWGLVGMLVLGTATVFASLSRGGIVSLLIAGAFTTLVLGSRKSLRGSGWVIVLLALGAFICVLYIGFDTVYDRLGTLRDLNRAEGGRWQILRDVAVAWTRFPLMGVGLGTHEMVYPMFDRSTAVTLASHAENEYAQAAEEMGAVGFLALLGVGLVVWGGYARTVRTGHRPIQSAVYGLGFGLLAVLIHSLSDFGQHVPANAFLSAIVCALLIRLSHLGRETEVKDRIEATETHGVRHGWLLVVLAGIVSVWAVAGADRTRRGERAWAKAFEVEQILAERGWQGSDREYTDLLTHAIEAQQHDPDHVKYRYWLSVYRWRAISRTSDPNATQILLTSQELEFVHRIIEELKETIPLCPVYGPPWSVMGQLERFICGRPEEGARHIWRGRHLAPCDSTTCYVAGMLLLEQGDVDAACEQWRRAVELDGGSFREIASRLVKECNRPDVAIDMAGENIHRLNAVADILEDVAENTELVRDARGRLVALLEQKDSHSNAPAWSLAWLARVYSAQGRVPDAIVYYRRALNQNYAQVEWRYHLARLLWETGEAKEALQEARTCLRVRPADPAVNRLVNRLVRDGGLSAPASRAP
jgi:tetratricopeptide (TPR) repeat protein